MPMSGKLGTVKLDGSAVAEVRNWSYDRTGDAKAYGHSGTNGRTGRRLGREDITGTFEIFLEAAPSMEIGDEASLTLFHDQGGSAVLTETVMITDISVNNDVDGAELASATVSFGLQADPA